MGIKHQKRTDLPKQIPKSTEGSCPYCHKHTKNIEAHIKSKHKEELESWEK